MSLDHCYFGAIGMPVNTRRTGRSKQSE